jgi:hypothetical protein
VVAGGKAQPLAFSDDRGSNDLLCLARLLARGVNLVWRTHRCRSSRAGAEVEIPTNNRCRGRFGHLLDSGSPTTVSDRTAAVPLTGMRRAAHKLRGWYRVQQRWPCPT